MLLERQARRSRPLHSVNVLLLAFALTAFSSLASLHMRTSFVLPPPTCSKWDGAAMRQS
jgi:hypothetical protein